MFDPSTHKVILSRSVIFDETQFPAKNKSISQGSCKVTAATNDPLVLLPNPQPSNSAPIPRPTIIDSTTQHSLSTSGPENVENNHSPQQNPETHPPDLPSQQIATSTESYDSTDPIDTSITPTQSSPQVSSTQQAPPPNNRIITRSQTSNLKPKEFLSALHIKTLPQEPYTFKQASSKPEWIEAMHHEYKALISNQTWTLCPRPSHHNVVRNKWVYKIKQKQDGSVDRYKARLVANGYDQLGGVDFYETFSPVVKTATIRLLLALAVQFDWQIKQLDVSNAFLHGVLGEEVYMEQPQGFIHPSFPHYVCRLHKSIYGLKQAPRAWFTRLSQALLNLGFNGSQVDSSLFLYHADSVHIFLLVYVDDIILTGNHEETMNVLIAKLKVDFAMKDLGPLGYFLGIQAIRDTNGLHLRQTKYIIDLLNRTHMAESKPYRAPCTAGSKMSKYDGEVLLDPTEYRTIVGALQYVTLTRPDIAYSVNQLCRHMHVPTYVHFTAAKRVLRYLKGTLTSGLHYCKGPIHLNAYCDADWAGNPDDRRSTTGYGVFLGPNLISWSAKKQHIVSRSSTEAENRSLSLTASELFWLRMLMRELHIALPCPPTIWCDNSGALALASNPVFHARTKHIEVDIHFIREKVTNRDIQLRYLSTIEQVADIFTKGHTADRFCYVRDKLRVVPPLSLRRVLRKVIQRKTITAI